QVVTSGVTELWLTFAPGAAPFDVTKPVKVTIDGTFVEAPPPRSDRSWNVKLSRSASGWKVLESFDTGLHKRHGLQGPIDDAFLDRFIMVKPTGAPMNALIGKWAENELTHAITHWRQQFRGDAMVKDDTDIAAADIASSN